MSFSWEETLELKKTEFRQSIISPREVERLLSMAQHIKYENNRNYQNVPKEDVLEHIEPELIDNVINELKSLITNFGFFTIHLTWMSCIY